MGRGVSPLDIFGYEFSHSLGRVLLYAMSGVEVPVSASKQLFTGREFR
jgi:hypothetical protein